MEKGDHLKPRKEGLEETKLLGTLIASFQPLEYEKNKFISSHNDWGIHQGLLTS